jgi:chromosome segregation ATPase
MALVLEERDRLRQQVATLQRDRQQDAERYRQALDQQGVSAVDFERLRSAQAQIQAQAAQAQAALARVDGEAEGLRQRLTRLEEERDQAVLLLERRVTELTAARQSIAELEVEIEELEAGGLAAADAQALQQELDTARTAAEVARSGADELRQEKRRLAAELAAVTPLDPRLATAIAALGRAIHDCARDALAKGHPSDSVEFHQRMLTVSGDLNTVRAASEVIRQLDGLLALARRD